MHVFLIAAVSVDGFIDRGSHQASTEWTSPEDKKFFRERTKQAGIMIVGRTTFETIGRALPGRKIFVLSSQPKPEKYAAIPDEAVEYTSQSPQELLQRLETAGSAEVAICGGSSVYKQFMEASLVQTLYLTMEPIIFGEGIKLVAGALDVKLQLKNITNLSEQTVLLEYQVIR